MTREAPTNTDRQRRLQRLDRLASSLDSRFSLFGLRFGWDSLLGLVPGLGDIVTAAPAAMMIVEGARLGARKRVLTQMAANGAIDLVVGGVPVLGDAFDVFFKSNKRNITLLRAELEHLNTSERRAAMAERHRSKDKSRDSDRVLGEEGSVGQQGRTGGSLQRDIASEDEKKRAFERPAGRTRVTKSDEAKA